jgi:hypothetical protein
LCFGNWTNLTLLDFIVVQDSIVAEFARILGTMTLAILL